MIAIDSFLDAVKAVLIASQTGVAELNTKNTVVFHHGQSDPDEDIAAGIAAGSGVSVLIYDLGGDNDPQDGDSPVILAKTAVELYVDVTKRRAKTVTYRTAGAIRDAIMSLLHDNADLFTAEHDFHSPTVTGYKPVEDPAYVVFRIMLQRVICLS